MRTDATRPTYACRVDATGAVRIEKLVAGGEGLARMADGRVVFVPGVVAGELVEIEIHEMQRDFARTRVTRVVEAASQRREPPCPRVADGCGGCDWQHIERRVQGQAKVAIVREAFERTAKMAVDPPLRRLAEDARRTTVRMASTGAGVGFRAADSHDVVPVDVCPVAHDLINDLLARPLLAGEGEVSLRVGGRTGDRAAWFHEGSPVADLPAGLRTGAKARVREVVDGTDFEVSMGSFFQSSPEAAELIVDSVRRRLDTIGARGGRLLDAYGGVGLFAVCLADRFDDVMLVESNPHACRDAVRNLADHAAIIEQAEMEHWDPTPADVVVADPARQGLGKRGAAALVASGASTLVLVSCDPVSAARDARLLVDAGFSLGEMEVLDIFPETHHVEVVTAFRR